MAFVGQEFGMCLGTVVGKQVWVAEAGAGGAGQASLFM